jgi:predicted metal-dependent peptidase
MSNEALNVIAKQTAAIVSEWNPTEVLIVRHTSKVVYTERLQQGQEPTPRKKRATGGTRFNPVLDYCESEGCEVIIWVSDMYPFETVKDNGIPVIWLGTESGSRDAWERYVGYGEYVQVSDL